MTPQSDAGKEYLGIANEVVDPSTGSLHLDLTIPTPTTGAAPGVPVGLRYDSAQAIALGARNGGFVYFGETNAKTGVAFVGWSLPGPYLLVSSKRETQTSATHYPTIYYNCDYLTNFVFVDRNSRITPFPMAWLLPDTTTDCNNMPQPMTNSTEATGAYATAQMNQGSASVTTYEGLQYQFTLPGSTTPVYPNFASDVHGNQPIATATTTMNSNLLSSVSVNGLANPYQFTWNEDTTSSTGSWSPGFKQVQDDGSANCVPPTSAQAFHIGLQTMLLPDSTSYQFGYDDSTGMLASITYPAGATVHYKWQVNPDSIATNWTDSNGSSSLGCVFRYGLPVVSKRILSYDGVHPAVEQDFTYGATTWDPQNPWLWTTKKTTVVTKDCIRAQSCDNAPQSTTVHTYTPCNNCSVPSANDPYANGMNVGFLTPQLTQETRVDYYDWNGTLLKTIEKSWTGLTLASEKTTLASGLVSLITYTGWCTPNIPYGASYYDWGQGTPGALLRTSTLARATGLVPALAQACVPASKSTYDGSGNLVAQEVLSRNTLGDITADTQCLLQSGQCAANSPTTTYNVNSMGLVTDKTDPCGNSQCSDMPGSSFTTHYDYTSYPAGGVEGAPNVAFLTGITKPTTGSGVTHKLGYSYNAVDGHLSSITDENGQQTLFHFGQTPSSCSAADLLDRLGEVDYPDGGQTTYCYQTVQPYVAVTSTMLMSTVGAGMQRSQKYDAFGRQVQNQLLSAPNGPITTDTSYDGAGLEYVSSNPYGTASDSTSGNIQKSYDALGRVISILLQDGTTHAWSYSGNISLETDEAGRQWQRSVDALGRLTAVAELGTTSDPRSLSTSYAYDALGSIVGVTQAGASGEAARVRTFTYDSLSRLLTSSNPEVGVLCFGQWNGATCQGGYDTNGNLVAKTDARGVVTQYSYDALNRMLGKTYLHDSTGSAASCYQYDTAAGGVGKLAASWTQAGSCAASLPTAVAISSRQRLRYDAVGRLVQEQQCVPGMCTARNSTSFVFNYTYDLMGNTTGMNDGLGQIIWSPTYDGAGRLLRITGSAAPGLPNPTQLFGNPTYSPAGELTGWSLGAIDANTPALVGAKTYDHRLRVTTETVTGHD